MPRPASIVPPAVAVRRVPDARTVGDADVRKNAERVAIDALTDALTGLDGLSDCPTVALPEADPHGMPDGRTCLNAARTFADGSSMEEES
jgi:hypothetical protein